MQLARNVGRNDKNIRIGAGIALLLVGFFGAGFFISLIGIVLIASGVLSFCPLYSFLGKSTATPAETAAASEDLTDRAADNLGDFKDEAVETAGEIKEKAGEKYDEFKSSELGKDTQEKFDDLKEKAGEVVDDIKSGEFTKDAKEKLSDLKEDAGELVDSAKEKLAKATDSNKKS